MPDPHASVRPAARIRGVIGGAAALLLAALAAAVVIGRGAPTEVVVWAGGVHRSAAATVIGEFERREDVRVRLEVDGCGVLADRLRAAEAAGAPLPDAFIPCDRAYLDGFASLGRGTDLGSTELVLAVPLGNPRALARIDDLAAPGLRLGVADARLSAMGRAAWRCAERLGCDAGLRRNLVTGGASADPLLHALADGRLDAAVVFAANAHAWRGRVAVVPLPHADIAVTSGAAVRRASPRAGIAQRLIDTLAGEAGAAAYRDAGFRTTVAAR